MGVKVMCQSQQLYVSLVCLVKLAITCTTNQGSLQRRSDLPNRNALVSATGMGMQRFRRRNVRVFCFIFWELRRPRSTSRTCQVRLSSLDHKHPLASCPFAILIYRNSQAVLDEMLFDGAMHAN